MTSVHQDLMARVSVPRLDAILLDTPFGFQENADEIAARTIAYFRQHVGCNIRLASYRHSGRATAVEFERLLAQIAEASYVFAGPGSPTYALRHWRDNAVRDRLIDKVREGGCLAFSSAAAIGLGAYALPVYEIYKVGEEPSWIPGLDVLGQIGVRCAVVPHYDNREGGTHDTRFCYMGEARLRLLEAMLPDDVLILGVDEHTACLIDVEAGSVTVRGRGGVTRRSRGMEQRWTRTTFPLSDLLNHRKAPASRPVEPSGSDAFGAAPVLAETRRWSVRGHEALDRGDVESVVQAILELESALREWAPEVGGRDEHDQLRAQMRHLVVRLGTVALRRAPGIAREQVAPLVDVLLSLRGEARREQRFNDADQLRAILARCGVEVKDTPSGTDWSVAQS